MPRGHLTFIAVVTAVALVLVLPALSSARTQPFEPTSLDASERSIEQALNLRATKALSRLARRVGEARVALWRCQDTINTERTRAADGMWGLPRSIAYRKWTIRLWEERAARCAEVLRFRVLPDSRDWQTAVRIVQRIYPGTQSWLLSCSAAEGGHGAWVWYGGRRWTGSHVGNDYLGMDTVGGWMQFRYSTFAPNWRNAAEHARAQGFVVPSYAEGRYDAWLSPLAQALTAAYMRAVVGSTGWHWSASVGNGC